MNEMNVMIYSEVRNCFEMFTTTLSHAKSSWNNEVTVNKNNSMP